MTETSDLLKGYFDKLPNIKNMIAIGGERRRGKDYLTSSLIERYGATRLAFGDEVRELAQEIFPWYNAYMPDDDKDKLYIHPNNNKKVTGRDILITVGKARDVDDYYFLRRFIEKRLLDVIANPNRLFVITDFRTKTEHQDFLSPLQIPTLKIVRDVPGLETHPFEVFIRDFQDTTIFNNNTEGSEAFLKFFPIFAKSKGVQFDGL